MTLKQLQYVIMVAETGTVTEAANRLFVAQPSLTAAIKELETEMNLTIFARSSKGVVVTKEGEIFLGYARQVLEQASLLLEKYTGETKRKQEFSVSTQHYSFAINAFVDLIKEHGQEEYDFRLRETETYEIITDVAAMRSEIGVLFLNDFNEAALCKILKANKLYFTELFVAKPHVFVSERHPLSKRESVTMEELAEFPYLSFEQGEHNSFYYSEELFSTMQRRKNIRVRDRATMMNLIIGLNGYTVCSGFYDSGLNGSGLRAVPLTAEGDMRLGYIRNENAPESRLGAGYVEGLRRYCTRP